MSCARTRCAVLDLKWKCHCEIGQCLSRTPLMLIPSSVFHPCHNCPPLPQHSLQCSSRSPPLALIPNSTLLAVGDVLAIKKDLVESRLLIIHGQAGVGKTALLRHLVESNCIRSKGYLRRFRTITTTSVCPRIHRKKEREGTQRFLPRTFFRTS